MSALIRLLRRRGSVRTLVLLTLLALTGGTLLTLASLRPRDAEPIDRATYDRLMSTRVQGLDDLMDWFYDQQDQWVRIIPPGLEELVQPGLPDVVVLDPEGKGWPEPLQKALAALKPTWRNSVPTYELDLHESLNGEITISDTSGNVLYTVPTPNDYQVPYEAVFRQSINPLLYEPWLNRYKLRARITLLPQDSVEHYLYAQAEQEAYAQQQAVPEQPMMLMSGGSEELAISGMELLTNGFRLTVAYPASFSGQVWSVYQQNTPALTADLTNSFNGLESIWSLAFNNLVLTGETATSWTDAQSMGSDTNGNPLHRFYGVGSNEVDSDEDGLSDAVEQFIHHTLPGDSDTDGDSLPDGWEVENGLDPRSNVGDDGYQGDPDHDGWINGQEYEDWTDPQDRLDANRFGPGIMISELVYRPAAGQNQWIELFNANEFRLPIDLGGFRIQRTQDGVYTTVLTIPSSIFIQPGDTLLVSGSGAGVTGDLTGPIDLEQPFDGTDSHTAGLRLIKPEGTPVGAPLVVDACLYDRPNQHACADQGFDAYTNGTFAPFTLAGNSLTRAWPGRDYNIGGSEWRWTNNPTPRAAGTGTDPDGDGLTTLQEWTGSNNPFGGWPTDPFDPDSDGDGLADGAEVTGTPATDPLGPDTDADDFPWDSGSTTWDHQETALGTSPINPDTDGDGLYDGWEVALGLNPLVVDSDSDGTGDGQEDGDGDGVSNQAEQAANSNPMNATQTTGGPYHYWHKPPKDGWANGDDVGYGGVLTVYFEGLKTGQVVCVVLKEGGGMAEKLSVQWQGAATPTCWSGARTGITAAVVAPGRNTMRLVVTDQSPAPDLSESNQGADIYFEPIEHPDLDGPGLFDRWPNQDEEDQEMTNGHVVVVNDDDDSPSQGNENWDHEDALGAKTNDARIRPFSLASLDGKWSTVKLTWQPQSTVAVYQDYGAGRSPVASGDTFEVTNLPDLFMEGLEASAAMRDTIMTASYDCEVCSDQIALTVVSADVDGDSNGDGSIDDLDDELEGSTNHPVFVSVNDNDSNGDGTNDHLNLVIDGASDLAEMTAVRVERIKPYDLPVGTVKLSGASNMRVFIADGTLVKPAAGDTASAVDLWTNLPCTLWAEGVGSGWDELTLTYRYQRSDGGTTEFSDVIQVCILKIGLVPDWNHDREITSADESQATASNPFRFWINDDNDYGDISDGDSDLPGEDVGGNFQPDYYTDDVDGRSDLLDFFPVWLDLKQTLDLLPPSGTIQYKLRQADSAVNAVYTDLTKGQAGDFLTTEGSSYGPSFNEDSYDADTFEVTSSGVVLDEDFLDKIINDENKGVLMIEGARETTAPLVLEVWKDGAKICETELPLSIAGVEKMYRWINVRGAAGGSVGRPTDTNNEPDNYPDDYCNGKQFVFVHGYSVHEEGARAWNAEIFKRLYQSGSRAMFTAATWYGNEGQVSDWIPFVGGSTPDYYSNVENAFATSSNLVAAINGLPGSKYIAGHSLGNMVVSSAIKDAGLSVSAYFMLNAAVAMESYDGTIITNTLRHPDWQNFSNRLWASEWHTLFSTNDGRGSLTWRGRFAGFSSAYNYFSSTEDVLDNADGEVPSLGRVQAWVCQEMRKGTTLIWLGPGNAEAGWGFNDDYSGLSVAQANALSNSVLRTNSFFLHFDDEDLYGANGSAVAQQPATYLQLLADAIPAMSNPMGRNEMGGWGASRNRDYMTQGGGSGFRRGAYPSGWPRSENDWRHSDIKNIAYPYNRNLFDKIVGDGGLQQ